MTKCFFTLSGVTFLRPFAHAQRSLDISFKYKLFRISAPLIDNFPSFKMKKAHANKKGTPGHVKVGKNFKPF